MTATRDQWTPPLLNPAIMDPWQALRVGLGIQRAALDCWRDSCTQAHELCSSSMDMGRVAVEQLVDASRDPGR